MKLTLHEIAKVVGAKNDVAAYEEQPLTRLSLIAVRLQWATSLPLKVRVMGMILSKQPLTMVLLATFTEKELPANQAHILVDDALEAFQKLAAYYLEKTGVDVIAVTGSNGKTTTKDMIHDIWQQPIVPTKTQGNYNNEIGLSLYSPSHA